MKQLYQFLILCIFSGVIMPLSANETKQEIWQQANDAYAQKEYQQSAELYAQLVAVGESSELFYNYANALYKEGQLAQSILFYERSLALNPQNEDAEANLKFANRQKTDKIVPLEVFFMEQWIVSLGASLSSNTWAYMSMIAFILALILGLTYLFGRHRLLRRIAFYSCVLLVFVSTVAGIYTFSQKQKETAHDFAIAMVGSSTVKSSPDESGTELFVIHEGTKVRIKSTLNDWAEVKLADGRVGWMLYDHIERI